MQNSIKLRLKIEKGEPAQEKDQVRSTLLFLLIEKEILLVRIAEVSLQQESNYPLKHTNKLDTKGNIKENSRMQQGYQSLTLCISKIITLLEQS